MASKVREEPTYSDLGGFVLHEPMDTTIKPPTRDRETYVVPCLALEEVETLSPDDREKLRAELRTAEARIEAGKCVLYDRDDQRRRFERIYTGGA